MLIIVYTQEDIKNKFYVVFLIKLRVLIINIVKKLIRTEDVVNKFIKSILHEDNYCRRVVKKYFCKNLIMTIE